MSIHNVIPHTSRYISTSNVFGTVFNAFTPGRYDFTLDPGCANIPCLILQQGSLYLIERISTGGNITEDMFLESIDDFPRLIMKRLQNNEPIYQQPLPIVSYSDNTEAVAWIYSDKQGDQLILSLEGRLRQLPSMVGILTARIQVSFHVYDIHDSFFIRDFRDRLSRNIGSSMRGDTMRGIR